MSSAGSKRKAEDEGADAQKKSRLQGGTLLFCGTNNWDPQSGLKGSKPAPKGKGKGKKKDAKGKGKKAPAPEPAEPPSERLTLLGPHVVGNVKDVRFTAVWAANSASHYGATTEDGDLYLFGRNDLGQLGMGNTTYLDYPQRVPGVDGVVSVGIGRRHTIMVTKDGRAFACGDNSCGQLGIGGMGTTSSTSPVQVKSGVHFVKAACGQDFSMLLGKDGFLYAFGMPEHGQLGDDDEGRYIQKARKISFNFVTSPKRIGTYCNKDKQGRAAPVTDVHIVDVKCGNQHTVALDSKGRVFTWGFGGHGQLGHSGPAKEKVARAVTIFSQANFAASKIATAGTASVALTVNGGFYFWGKTKSTGESTMYPKPNYDCQAGNIVGIAGGQKHLIVLSDLVVTWAGSPTFGELGYGAGQPKSSTKPNIVEPLDGIPVTRAAGGYAATLLLAEHASEAATKAIDALPTYDE